MQSQGIVFWVFAFGAQGEGDNEKEGTDGSQNTHGCSGSEFGEIVAKLRRLHNKHPYLRSREGFPRSVFAEFSQKETRGIAAGKQFTF